eukprot:471887_1
MGREIQQWTVLILTFISYASYHACRQSFADAKTSTEEHWNYTKHEIGTMDSIFLFSYAFGLYGSGLISDIFDAKSIHALGLFFTGIILIIFTVTHTYSMPILYIIWMFNGLFQSLGWPSAVKIVANWLNTNHAGAIFGIWASNQCVGNIIGALYVTFVHTHNLSIQWMFYFPSIQAIIISILIFIFVKTNPPNNSLQIIESSDTDALQLAQSRQINDKSSENEQYEESITDTNKQRMSFIEILKLKNVIVYSLCFACIKSVNYSMFFWLPYFETNYFNAVRGDVLLITYNLAQIGGGWICGYASDRFYKRTPVLMAFLIASIVPIVLLHLSALSYGLVVMITFIAGFMIGGPYAILNTVMGAEIAKDAMLRGNYSIVSTVTGIIDGSGSIGSAIIMYVVVILSDKSVELVFIMLGCLLLLSAVLLAPTCLKDIRQMYTRYHNFETEEVFGGTGSSDETEENAVLIDDR